MVDVVQLWSFYSSCTIVPVIWPLNSWSPRILGTLKNIPLARFLLSERSNVERKQSPSRPGGVWQGEESVNQGPNFN